jgi:hypothetical protein
VLDKIFVYLAGSRFEDISEYDTIFIRKAVNGSMELSTLGFLMTRARSK